MDDVPADMGATSVDPCEQDEICDGLANNCDGEPEADNCAEAFDVDQDGDGKADKQTVFADGLHLPTGFEVGDGGVYVAQEPNLIHLVDTDGDDKADEKHIIFGGFDSGDSHHAIGAFVWGPGGGIYMHEGTFHITQVETPYGVIRNGHGAVYRVDPL